MSEAYALAVSKVSLLNVTLVDVSWLIDWLLSPFLASKFGVLVPIPVPAVPFMLNVAPDGILIVSPDAPIVIVLPLSLIILLPSASCMLSAFNILVSRLLFYILKNNI